jgi:dipeptidyl aminopeptidase/acylaminoacyl peptidase
MVSSVDNSDFSQLLEGYEGTINDISWINNETIRFVASRSVWTVYSQVNYDGSGHKTLLDEKEGAILNSFSTTSGGGQTAFVADLPHHPAELYYMGSEEESPVRKTELNPILDNIKLGEQEMVSYKARDGKEIHGVLVRPVDEDPNRRYPLITVVHGGPEAHYDMGWHSHYSEPAQVAAARGFAVFFPNYRGSTGRGIEFLKSSQGDPAGKEFDDIVDGVDYLIDKRLVDPNRVGVTGGSYGGYATGWLSTKYTDRFAAGVMFVGISDNISKWGTSDIPQELFLVHTRQRIWDDWDFYLKRSPIYHTNDTETPLLIMHGKEDPRVNPGQSYEMYRYLKVRSDAPVRLVLYPGEGHGNAHATARYDYQLRLLRWMEHYLKGPGGEKPDDELKVGN